MATYLCHVEPELLEISATVVGVRPGAVALDRTPFHPGGGGQVADRGVLETSIGSLDVIGIEVVDDVWWHLLADESHPLGEVHLDAEVVVQVDGEQRRRVASLHTVSHILNALVFEEFAGALVTGAQINADGTGRMDFDLPAVDNDRLRALAEPVNSIIAAAVEVRSVLVDATEAAGTPGLIRSMSVAPPPSDDGLLRIIEIDGIDRQACGGTHLSNTGQAAPIRIGRVENKGRHNRRIRFEFA